MKKKQASLSQVQAGQEINIPTSFTVTLPGKKNATRKFKSNKSYWVAEVKDNGVMVDYHLYNGRVKNGYASEFVRFDKNRNLEVNIIS